MTTRVRLPDREADRPDPFGLLAVALATLCAGLWVARVMSGLPPNGAETNAAPNAASAANVAATEPGVETAASAIEEASAEPSTATGAANAVEPELAANAAETEPAPSPEVSAAIAAARQPESAPAPEPEQAPEPAAAQAAAEPEAVAIAKAPEASQPRFKLGIVAYDRCDGLPQRPGRFPCPRDLSLEQQVWHALRALEVCPIAAAERGAAELRFEFENAASASSLRVRALPGSSFDHAAVTKCAGLALSAVRTRLLSDHMVVRFRFELR